MNLPAVWISAAHMKEVANELIILQEMGKTALVITHDYELTLIAVHMFCILSMERYRNTMRWMVRGFSGLEIFLSNRGDPGLNRNDLFFLQQNMQLLCRDDSLCLSNEKRERRWNSDCLCGLSWYCCDVQRLPHGKLSVEKI